MDSAEETYESKRLQFSVERFLPPSYLGVHFRLESLILNYFERGFMFFFEEFLIFCQVLLFYTLVSRYQQFVSYKKKKMIR